MAAAGTLALDAWARRYASLGASRSRRPRRWSGECGRSAELVRLASLLEWLLLGGAGAGADRAAAARPAGPGAFVALAVALVALDLFKAGMGYNPAIPVAHAEQPVTAGDQLPPAPAAGALRRPRRDRRRRARSARMPPNVAMRYGLDDARGYDYPVEDATTSSGRPTSPQRAAATTPSAASRPRRRRAPCGRSACWVSPTSCRTARDPPLREPGVRLPTTGPTPGSTEPARAPARLPRRAPGGRAGRGGRAAPVGPPDFRRGDRWP